jgi:hypothetical protein
LNTFKTHVLVFPGFELLVLVAREITAAVGVTGGGGVAGTVGEILVEVLR